MVIIPLITPITILWDMMGVLYHFPIRTFEDLKIANCIAEMFEGVNLYRVFFDWSALKMTKCLTVRKF